MKFILSCLFVLFTISINAQNLDYKSLKNFIGNRVVELEEFYDIKATLVDDNFGNQKVIFTAVEIPPFTVDMVVETIGKNISKITVTNTKNRTSFFQTMALEIEKSSPVKKNFKTYYVSLVKKSTKKKTYQESIEQLIEVIKKPTTNLADNYGLLDANALNAQVTIDDKSSILTIN